MGRLTVKWIEGWIDGMDGVMDLLVGEWIIGLMNHVKIKKNQRMNIWVDVQIWVV